MLLAGFHPKSQLVTKTTPVEKPRFLLIDPHNHLSEPYGGGWDEKPLLELLDLLDEAGVITYVYLDGSWSEKKSECPGRPHPPPCMDADRIHANRYAP